MLSVACAIALPGTAVWRLTDYNYVAKDVTGDVCWEVQMMLADDSTEFLNSAMGEPDSVTVHEILDFALATDAYLTWGNTNNHIDSSQALVLTSHLNSYHYGGFLLTPASAAPPALYGAYVLQLELDGIQSSALTTGSCAVGTGVSFQDHTHTETSANVARQTIYGDYSGGVAGANGMQHFSGGPSLPIGSIQLFGVGMPLHEFSVSIDMGDNYCPNPGVDEPPIHNSGPAEITAEARSVYLLVLDIRVTFNGEGHAECTAAHSEAP